MANFETSSPHHHNYFGPHQPQSSSASSASRHGNGSQFWSIHDPTSPHSNLHPHLSQMRHHRRRHPPPPSVEDEVESLSKEHPPQRILRESDVRSRGTVNQEPILIELENHDRRFVLLSDPDGRPIQTGRRQDRGVPEKKNNAGPPLTLDTEQSSFLNRRKPSPYSYSKSDSSLAPSRDYFLSPDGIYPPSATNPPRSTPTEKSSRSNKEDAKERSSVASSDSNTSYRSDASDDSDLDAREARRRRSKQSSRSARVSFTEQEAAHHRHLSFNNAPRAPSLRAELSRSSIEASLAARIGSDFASDDRSGSRTPTAPPRSHPSISQPVTPRGDIRVDPTYTSSPRNDPPRHISISGPQPSPPGSPGLSHSSLPSSPQGLFSSRNDSKPPSPVPQSPYETFAFESPRGRYERSVSYGLPLQQKTTKAPFKLNSSMRHSSTDSLPVPPPRIDVHSASPARSSKSFLPYPDEDVGIAMPSATKFQTRTESFSSSLEPGISHHRQSSVSSNGSVSSTSKTNPARPDLSSKKTLQEGSAGSRTPFTSEDESVPRRKEKQQSVPSISTNLPPCPRTDYMRGYDDWHCLEIYPDFDICPTCYYEILRPTPFRKFLMASPPRQPNVPIRCEFGSPWARLAWLLTLKQERQDLNLIYALVKISSTESRCPGDKEAVGTWYGLQDQTGAFVPNFTVCPRDKKYIESLFPSLFGTLTRLVIGGMAPRQPFVCSLRSQSRGFPIYLHLLDDMHDAALELSSKQSPSSSSSYNRSRSPNTNPGAIVADPRPLIDLAKSLSGAVKTNSISNTSNSTSKTSYVAPKADPVPTRRECTRNRVQPANSLWHFIPEFPIFTVCEPCFDTVVWPAVKRGSSIADRFNQTLQPVPQPYTPTAGSSFSSSTTASTLNQASSHTCQLYSPRMRRVFERAVQRGDMQLLVEKVRERKEMEVELRQQRADLLRLLGSLNSSGAGYASGSGGVDRERLKRELERVENSWEDWE